MRAASVAKVTSVAVSPCAAPPLVVVGCSAGGLVALRELFSAIPQDFTQAVAVVQHGGSLILVDVLKPQLCLSVDEAIDKTLLRPGHVMFAPPDYHLLIEGVHYAFSVDPPVRYSRPSIDVLFESAAEALGSAVTGILLTGANEDGARGLERIKALGGRVAVQDPASAEYSAMPLAAIGQIGRSSIDLIASAREIGQWLVESRLSQVLFPSPFNVERTCSWPWKL